MDTTTIAENSFYTSEGRSMPLERASSWDAGWLNLPQPDVPQPQALKPGTNADRRTTNCNAARDGFYLLFICFHLEILFQRYGVVLLAVLGSVDECERPVFGLL